jgi:hypothetical protein
MKSGFFRLWMLASALWTTGCAATLAFRIFAKACMLCIVYVVVRRSDTQEESRDRSRHSAQPCRKPICGDARPSLLLYLEGLAKEGLVTQVAFQWQESGGWSSDIHAFIGILNGKEISVAAIHQEVREAVRTDRLRGNVWLAYVGVGVPSLAFLFAGFKSAQ